MIRADVYTSDHRVEVDFDAEPWFRQAKDWEIVEVAVQQFGPSFITDRLVIWMQGHNKKIAKLLEYIGKQNLNGNLVFFIPNVNEGDATDWVYANRRILIGSNGEIRKRFSPKDWSPKNRHPKEDGYPQ